LALIAARKRAAKPSSPCRAGHAGKTKAKYRKEGTHGKLKREVGKSHIGAGQRILEGGITAKRKKYGERDVG